MFGPWRRWVLLVVMLLSVGAVSVILYRSGIRDEGVFFGVAALLLLYEWAFLWR